MPRRLSARLATFARFAAPLLASFLLAFSVIVALSADHVSAQTFTPGTQARVAADGDTLRMRTGATVSASVIASIPDGSIVNIREGSQAADGYTWQFIEWNGAIGWVASEYLQALGTAPTATPSATPTPTTTPSATPTTVPPTTGAAGLITGTLPPAGKAGLIVWGGGTMDSLVATASGRDCNVRSVYAIRNGRFVGYTPGAPAFVNASWESQVGSLTSVSALLVFCDAVSQSGVSSPPASGGQSVPASSPAAAPSGGLPPGPGGNEA